MNLKRDNSKYCYTGSNSRNIDTHYNERNPKNIMGTENIQT